MADEEWATNSTEATTISLWRQGKNAPEAISEFKPTFTYPIFGDEESIFGYKDLEISLGFASHNLLPNVSWTYDKKFSTVGETKALDLNEALSDFVQKDAFAPKNEWARTIQEEDSSSFQPPGELVRSWRKDGRQYEIWSGTLTDPGVKTLLDRAQVLVSLYIEGGTHIETDDQEWTIARWRIFFLYEKLATPPTPTSTVYSIVGYSTSYRFLTFIPDGGSKNSGEATFEFPSTKELDILSLPYRGRISQFLILPPHAHQGHGSMLYATMFKHFLNDPSCIEITVEDPNEAFDDLRDYCDFTRLLQNGTLEKIRMNHDLDPKLTMRGPKRRAPLDSIVNKQLRAKIRKDNKLAPRQFARLVELWLFSRLPSTSRSAGTARLTKKAKATDEGDRAMYYWRLLVKARIYKQNRDKLVELEQSEAVGHLEETTNNLIQDYERLLAKLAQKALQGASDETDDRQTAVRIARRGKRKVVEEDDEDEDESDDRGKRQKSVTQS